MDKTFGWDEMLSLKEDIARIIKAQKAQGDVLNSLVALISQQAKLLQDMVTLLLTSQQDQAKVDALSSLLKSSADQLAASVAANQPK